MQETLDDVAKKIAEAVLPNGISAASIIVNNRCNLACKHCYVLSPERKTGFLSKNYRAIDEENFSKEIALKIAQDLKGKALFVTMPSMEPLLDKKSSDISLAIAQELSKKAAVSIITNATRANQLTKEQILLLNKNVDYLSISAEGDKKTHDFIRGTGAFDGMLKGLKYLAQNGYDLKKVTLQMTIHPNTNNPYAQTQALLKLVKELKVGKASITANITPQLTYTPTKANVVVHVNYFKKVLDAIKASEKDELKEKLITLYSTYESPAAVIAMQHLMSQYENFGMEYNAFEFSNYVRLQGFDSLDVRLETAPFPIEIPCYPRVAASTNGTLFNWSNNKTETQGAHMTHCFAYQTDEVPWADWVSGTFTYLHKQLTQHGKDLAWETPQSKINLLPSAKYASKEEYLEQVLYSGVNTMLSRTTKVLSIYDKLKLKKNN